MKTALITGITGQDGSFLAEFLLDKGYDVHGTIRRSSVDYRERIAHLEGQPRFHLHYADLGDSMSIIQVVNKVRPDEIGGPPVRAGRDLQDIPGVYFGALRQGRGGASEREHAVPSVQPVCGGEALRVLDSQGVP